MSQFQTFMEELKRMEQRLNYLAVTIQLGAKAKGHCSRAASAVSKAIEEYTKLRNAIEANEVKLSLKLPPSRGDK